MAWHQPWKQNWEDYFKIPEINIRENAPRRNGPPTTTNISGNGQYIDKKHRQWNGKTKISIAIDMRFYCVRDIILQNHFHIFWENWKKNLADYVAKKHPIWPHIKMRPRYFKATKKYIENSKYR